MKKVRELSDAEHKLFKALGHEWLIKQCEHEYAIPAPKAYDMVAMEMFKENRTGPAVEALRRGINALHNCKVYRLTPEFDELISF